MENNKNDYEFVSNIIADNLTKEKKKNIIDFLNTIDFDDIYTITASRTKPYIQILIIMKDESHYDIKEHMTEVI